MKQIAAALVKAQKAFGPALKTSTNPHFKSRYAALDACIEAVIDGLNDSGIALIQRTYEDLTGVTVETVFVHESGEMLECGKFHVPSSKLDPQAFCSALTYARRYSLMAACGIAPEDDDGNAESKKPEVKESAPVINDQQAADIHALVDETKSDIKGLLEWVSHNSNCKVTKIEEIPRMAHTHVVRMLEKKRGAA
jgi:hypothetical protein